MADNYVDNLSDRLSKLPGIGRKSAKRLAFHILNMPEADVDALVDAIVLAKDKIQRCKMCGNFSQEEICPICSSPNRDHSKLMVVASVKDIDAFEESLGYDGLYFVLKNDELSPVKGIGPKEIGADEFVERLKSEEVKEIILALATNIESEHTAKFLSMLAKEAGKKVSTLSTGLPVGGVLEYFDPLTLRRSYEARIEI